METWCSKRFALGSPTGAKLQESVRSGRYLAGVSRLRPLSESECYHRLYGDRESTVAVLRGSEPDRPSGGLLGEQIMKLFAERLDGVTDKLPEEEAA
jgi:hypothetical protein